MGSGTGRNHEKKRNSQKHLSVIDNGKSASISATTSQKLPHFAQQNPGFEFFDWSSMEEQERSLVRTILYQGRIEDEPVAEQQQQGISSWADEVQAEDDAAIVAAEATGQQQNWDHSPDQHHDYAMGHKPAFGTKKVGKDGLLVITPAYNTKFFPQPFEKQGMESPTLKLPDDAQKKVRPENLFEMTSGTGIHSHSSSAGRFTYLGFEFPLELIMLFVFRAYTTIKYRYRIAIEYLEFSKYDDFIIWNIENGIFNCFQFKLGIQRRLWTAADLMSQSENDPLALKPYFQYFETIKGKFKAGCKCILFTNRVLIYRETIFKEYSLTRNDFEICRKEDNILNLELLKLREGVPWKEELVKYLTNGSGQDNTERVNLFLQYFRIAENQGNTEKIKTDVTDEMTRYYKTLDETIYAPGCIDKYKVDIMEWFTGSEKGEKGTAIDDEKFIDYFENLSKQKSLGTIIADCYSSKPEGTTKVLSNLIAVKVSDYSNRIKEIELVSEPINEDAILPRGTKAFYTP